MIMREAPAMNPVISFCVVILSLPIPQSRRSSGAGTVDLENHIVEPVCVSEVGEVQCGFTTDEVVFLVDCLLKILDSEAVGVVLHSCPCCILRFA